jgi:iron complex outermembrane receptor protein
MQQGALNTNRITIRGIGSRQFGTTKIKAYFDGIPLTTGDGETTLDDLDLASIEKSK